MVNPTPTYDKGELERLFGSGRGRLPLTDRFRHLVADRAVGTKLIVVSTPSLAFLPGVVQIHEPVNVQAIGLMELAHHFHIWCRMLHCGMTCLLVPLAIVTTVLQPP